MTIKRAAAATLMALSSTLLMADALTLQAGGFYKTIESGKCGYQGCTQGERLSLQYVHVFAITPEQAAGITANTQFVLQSEWGSLTSNANEDPSFVNGKRSVRVSNFQDVGGKPTKVFMKMDWTTTQMRIMVYGSRDFGATSISQSKLSKTVQEKAASTFSLVSIVSPPVVAEFTAKADLKVFSKQGQLESINEFGATKVTGFFSVTSFGFEQGTP